MESAGVRWSVNGSGVKRDRYEIGSVKSFSPGMARHLARNTLPRRHHRRVELPFGPCSDGEPGWRLVLHTSIRGHGRDECVGLRGRSGKERESRT